MPHALAYLQQGSDPSSAMLDLSHESWPSPTALMDAEGLVSKPSAEARYQEELPLRYIQRVRVAMVGSTDVKRWRSIPLAGSLSVRESTRGIFVVLSRTVTGVSSK